VGLQSIEDLCTGGPTQGVHWQSTYPWPWSLVINCDSGEETGI
jgi:hypothetical protein